SIDYFSLLIHYIVIFKNMLSYTEVLTFDLLLGIFYRLCKHSMFYWSIVVHTKSSKKLLNLFTTKQSHKIIIKSYINSRFPWLSLTTRTTSQLIIYSTRLMSFST